MKNLIVCCDGTWNTPDQRHDGVLDPTNVVRLYNAVAEKDADGNPQERYYHPGVGSDGNWWEKLAGGGFGHGLTKNIMSAYRWLAGRYEPGDRICLFGFSRGAYTARSLAGIITGYGLLDLTDLPDDQVWKRVEAAENAYRNKTHDREDWARGWVFHEAGSAPKVQVHFVGVWDTVGALGIPNDLAILNLLDKFNRFEFHDTKLSNDTLHARHAVAIDEKRAPFSPTLWTEVEERPDVKQVWFPGMHCDVGGGYPESELSDLALKWMIEEASAPEIGIVFVKKMVDQISPDYKGEMHDSFTGPMRVLKSRPRSIPLLDGISGPILHESVLQRKADPPITVGKYRETRRLAMGEPFDVEVFAIDPWNETTVYLEEGRIYRFRARGQWLDRKIACGPEGADDAGFRLGELAHIFGSALGGVEGIWKRITGNEEADFKFTKRFEEYRWFRLLGAVANGHVQPDGTTEGHEIIDIGEGTRYRITKPGYLYCFANDAWGFYGNNKGSVTLSIECVE